MTKDQPNDFVEQSWKRFVNRAHWSSTLHFRTIGQL
jgi:hypothetical protein